MRRPKRRSKKQAPEELKWCVSSAALDFLLPEEREEYSRNITQIVDRRIQESQYVALRDTLKVDRPASKLPGKTKRGPDSNRDLSRSVYHRQNPRGPGRAQWKDIRFRVKKAMKKDHGVEVNVRTLVRHGITKKGVA